MRRLFALVLVMVGLWTAGVMAQDITLVKRARRTADLKSVSYTVQKDDTLWKIFLHEYRARPEELPALYRRFRELNPNIHDLDYIRAGQRVVIPRLEEAAPQEARVQPSSEERYILKRGEHLAKVLREVYGIPDKLIFNEYLALIKKLNPEIENLDHVVPGQAVRMPATLTNNKAARVREAAPPAGTPEIPSEDRAATPLKVESPAPPQPPAEAPAAPPAVTPERAAAPEERPERATLYPAGVVPGPVPPEAASAAPGQAGQVSRLVRNTLLPALSRMGGSQKDQGTFFLPVSGGSSISIDTQEMPVMELDTGRRIILDLNDQISPEVKALVEEAFPSCSIIKDSGGDLEGMMNKVLSVSGYFSINTDAGPLLVGEEEKVRFSGKWIVYKDFSRRNVFVINVLSEDESRTPAPIRDYASRFGIDLIEMGGLEANLEEPRTDYVKILDRSYPQLFDRLGVAYEQDRHIELVASEVMQIAYTAPILVGRTVLADKMPEKNMQSFIARKGLTILNTRERELGEVLKAVGVDFQGPPVKIQVASGRTEIDLDALRVGQVLILKRAVDQDIARFLSASGMDVLIW